MGLQSLIPSTEAECIKSLNELEASKTLNELIKTRNPLLRHGSIAPILKPGKMHQRQQVIVQ